MEMEIKFNDNAMKEAEEFLKEHGNDKLDKDTEKEISQLKFFWEILIKPMFDMAPENVMKSLVVFMIDRLSKDSNVDLLSLTADMVLAVESYRAFKKLEEKENKGCDS